MKKFYKKTKEGFTLIELLVVISIVSLLSSVVLGGLKSARAKSKNTAYVTELVQLRNALNLYRNETGIYPGEEGSGTYVNDYNGSGGYANTLDVLVTNDLIPEIPHHPDWPSNSSGNPRTYTVYSTDQIYDWGGGYTYEYDYACAYGGISSKDDLPDHRATIRVITNDPDVELPGMEPGISYCGNWGCHSWGGPNSTYKYYCLGI